MIDAVSEIYRCDWDKATKIPVMEFLNVYSYTVAKNENQRMLIEKQINRKR